MRRRGKIASRVTVGRTMSGTSRLASWLTESTRATAQREEDEVGSGWEEGSKCRAVPVEVHSLLGSSSSFYSAQLERRRARDNKWGEHASPPRLSPLHSAPADHLACCSTSSVHPATATTASLNPPCRVAAAKITLDWSCLELCSTVRSHPQQLLQRSGEDVIEC